MNETMAYIVGAARIQRTAVAETASAPGIIAFTLTPERRPETARIWLKDVFLPTTGVPTRALPIVEVVPKAIVLAKEAVACVRATSAELERCARSVSAMPIDCAIVCAGAEGERCAEE